MRTYFKLAALSIALLAAGCQSTGTTTTGAPNPNEPMPPKNAGFTSEMAKFNAQFPSAKVSAYEDTSLAFNNQKKLDEKGNCHGKSIHPVTIMLILDASGRVTSTMTDVENAKAACFRQAYGGVQFPKPPMAPYRKPIILK